MPDLTTPAERIRMIAEEILERHTQAGVVMEVGVNKGYELNHTLTLRNLEGLNAGAAVDLARAVVPFLEHYKIMQQALRWWASEAEPDAANWSDQALIDEMQG